MQSTECRTAAGSMKEIKRHLGGGWKLAAAQGSQDKSLHGGGLQRKSDLRIKREGILGAA